MFKHKVWVAALVLAMGLMLSGIASAWEFNMSGDYVWLFEHRGQLGHHGFFGPYDVDAGSGTTAGGGATNGYYAPLNAWLGPLMGDMVSGTEGQRNTMWMTDDMELRINPAVRVRGQYYIGEWFDTNPGVDSLGEGELVASQYYNSRYPGVQRAFSPGYWNMLWLTAQLPWGEVAMGKRRSSFGMGMYNNGEDSRSSEKLSLTTFYGPLRIGLAFYPSRRADTKGTTNAFVSSPPATGAYFNGDNDKNNNRWWDATIPSVTYRSGDLDVGFYVNPIRWHLGGEGIINTPTIRSETKYVDREDIYGVSYMKYNNGRFFFNAEVDFDQQLNRNRQKNSSGVNVTHPAPQPGNRDTYIENWRFATETGVLCGPAKLAFLYAWASGPDRRYGAQIDRTGLIGTDPFANTGLFRPYSYLAVYGYGLGTSINGSTGNGYVEDASVIAARLDYAVASNLNVYGSFFYADRASKSGWGWGFIRPVSTAGAVGIVRDTNDYGAPSIPDSNLGYEIDSGFDWKLLEGFRVDATFAYWQPGKWFRYACVDKSVPNWANPVGPRGSGSFSMNPANWGINPNRTIDPIWGLELLVQGEF
jgi:hypothetical protein